MTGQTEELQDNAEMGKTFHPILLVHFWVWELYFSFYTPIFVCSENINFYDFTQSYVQL